MTERMSLGGSSSIGAVPAGSTVEGNAAKLWNDRTVKYEEQLYWLMLELNTTRKEKSAVEDRLSKLFGDLEQLKDPSSSSTSDDIEALTQKHERTVRTLQMQIDLLRSSSNEVVDSLKAEIRDVLQDKARSETDRLNALSELEKLKKGVTHSAPEKDMFKEFAKLKRERDELAEALRNERLISAQIVSTLRNEKTALLEQVEKMQGDLLVLRASVDTVHSIDQMKQDRDESMQALELVSTLWDRADSTLTKIQEFMEPLLEDDGENDDKAKYLSALEKATLLHGQVKVSLMLVEMKLRNTLACLKNDSSQLAVAITDRGVAKQIEDAKNQVLAEVRQVAILLPDSSATPTDKAKKDLSKLSIQEVCQMAQDHNNDDSITVYRRQLLDRLATEVKSLGDKIRLQSESIGRNETAVAEYQAREKTLVSELKRFVKEHNMKIRQDRDTLPLIKLLEQHNDDEEEVVEIVEDVEEEIIEEEIIEDSVKSPGPKLGIMIEEEEEEIVEVVEH